MRLLKNKAAVPFEDGRHVWRFYEADTETWLTHPRELDRLAELVAQHRAANDLPPGRPVTEIEEQLFERLPGLFSYQ